MENSFYGRREDGESRGRRQQSTAHNASSYGTASGGEDENSYLIQRKEQIYGVFADEVEDEVEEEQAARRTQKKSSGGRLLLVSGTSSSSEAEGEGGSGDDSGESEDDTIPEGCITRGRRRSRSKEKKSVSGRYGRRVHFVEGGVWKPETAQQQKKRKTGEQPETENNAVSTSSSSSSVTGRATGSGNVSSVEDGGEDGAEKKKKQSRPAAAAGVLGENGEEDETECSEAGCMSLRERILNAQVLKEVLGDAYYELSSEDEDVKSSTQHETATAAGSTETSSESSTSGRSSVATKTAQKTSDSADAVNTGGKETHIAGQSRDPHQESGQTAEGEESSSSSDDDVEANITTMESATRRQRSFRFASNARGGDTGGAQQGQQTAEGGAGSAPLAKEKNTWGFAKMEKTYGVGFKLLKKMGFKGGGLGRHGTGVANPLEVRIREKNKGLQDSGEKFERKKSARGKQLTALDILLGARKREKSAAGEETETFVEAWKKPDKGGSSNVASEGMSAAERRRRRLGGRSPAEMSALRVEELQRSLRSSNSVRRQGPAVRIIDMTGPEVRLIENESELQQTLQQQKQRAAAAGGQQRRGKKLGGIEKSSGVLSGGREKGRGEEDEWSDGALLSDEEPLASQDMDEEENAESARLRNLPFKAFRKRIETIVHAVEAQLESVVRDKKVGEQMLLESVDYMPVTGGVGVTASLLSGSSHDQTLASVGTHGRSAAAADPNFHTGGSGQDSAMPLNTGEADSAIPSAATAARLYEEEVASAVRDVSVVADKAAALLQQVQALYMQVKQTHNSKAPDATQQHTASQREGVKTQAKESGEEDDQISKSDSTKKTVAGSPSTTRKHTFSRSAACFTVAGEENDRWSESETSRSCSPSVARGNGGKKDSNSRGAQSADEASSSSASVTTKGDATDTSSASSISNGTELNEICSVDLDSLVVAAEEWRSAARFEFRLLQLPAILAALAGLVLERRLQRWVPWEGMTPGASAAESGTAINAEPIAPAEKTSGTTLALEKADGVTASSVARLLAFLVSLQQHEEAETHAFLSAMTSVDEKIRASVTAGNTGCWAAGLLAASTAGGIPPGGRDPGGRGAAVAKCLQKWQDDEIARIEDEAFGARKRGIAASRRMRSTLGLFPLRLEGSTGTLRLLQLPMRECAEPYRLGFDILEKVLQVAVVNPLRAAIVNNWQPEREGEKELSVYPTMSLAAAGHPDAADSAGCYPCLTFMEKWSAALPTSCFRQLVEEAVVPKLLQGINMWDPSRARVPVHIWVQPWLPYLSREHLQLLSLPLQAKIAAALDAKWHPSDRSAVGLLIPWKNVFDAYSFAALLQRSVMPKLHDHLLNMPVRPDHQRLEPLQDVLAWGSLLPLEMLVNLFLTAFFPRWLQVLRVWLASPQVDLNEVLVWYGGWKQILPPALLAHPRVQSGVLVEALQLMNFASATVGMQAVGGAPAAAGVSAPHLQQPPPPGIAATSALPHVSPLRQGAGLSGAAADHTAAASTSGSPGYVLHRELGVGVSPFPAPPPTAAPPPPPAVGAAAAAHVGAAAATSQVGDVVSGGPVKPAEPEEPISLLEYLEGLAKEKNILFKPKPGRVEEGKQVYAYGRMNMYVKEKLIYVKGKAIHTWTAVDVDELLKLAKGEWVKLKGTTFERK